MSGDIVWKDNPGKLYKGNHPALLFYLIACVGETFGYSEIPMHLLLSIFTFFALYFFLQILKLFSTPHKDLLLGIFALCPAFIVNQNLMTDIPILALEMAFFYSLLKADTENNPSRYIHAGLALGIALLIKFSIIPLVLVMCFAILLKKHYRYLLCLMIPLGMLGLWSWFNVIEYGGVQILDRKVNELTPAKILEQSLVFAGCIGAVAPFSIVLFYGAVRKKPVLLLNIVILLSFLVFALLVYHGIIPESSSSEILKQLFILNGGLLFILLLIEMAVFSLKMKRPKPVDNKMLILYAWLLSISGFMILYAPSMSTRHILLILPAILLIGIRLFEKAGRLMRIQALVTTSILGILFGISDWQYADFYRRMAGKIELPNGARVWSSGHWGWQWYSAKNNMMLYSTDSARVRTGDYLIYPLDVSRQVINKQHKLTEIKRIWEPASMSTFFSGKDFGSLYIAFPHRGSWELSMEPIDTIIISKIEIINEQDSLNPVP